jgi:hypothetical protein
MSRKKRQQQRAEAKQLRREFLATYGPMIDACSQAMHEVNLLGIDSSILPLDEFDTEAERVVPRLAGCMSFAAVRVVLYDELGEAFDGVPPHVIEDLAGKVWRLMEVHGYRM